MLMPLGEIEISLFAANPRRSTTTLAPRGSALVIRLLLKTKAIKP